VKKVAIFLLLPVLLCVGCASTHRHREASSRGSSLSKRAHIRTTAYTHTEAGGRRNAIGGRLSGGGVKSAASDWSRYPLGTKFQVLQTSEVYKIDDYGSALIGTNTIDLYKSSRSSMRQWGVRFVDIEILEWGCKAQSLKVLKPRARTRHVRQMVSTLRSQVPGGG
jgi:3D (Asp-Asp-Asp) domain-containing protein